MSASARLESANRAAPRCSGREGSVLLGLAVAVALSFVAVGAAAQGASPGLQQRFEGFARDVCGGASGDLRGLCEDLGGTSTPGTGLFFQADFNVPSTLATLFGLTSCGATCNVQCTATTCRVDDGFGFVANVPNPGLGMAPPPVVGQVQIQAATRDIIPDEATTLGPAATRTARHHSEVLAGRAAALRAGASGVDVTRLDLRDSAGHFVSGDELQQAFDERSEAGAGDLMDGRLGVWANGLGEWGEFDGRGDEPAFDFDQAGVIAGLDYRLGDHVVLGGAFGWSDAEYDFPGGSGDLDKQAFSGSLYGTAQLSDFYVDGSVTYNHLDFDLKRRIRLPFQLSTARGSTDGEQWGITVGGGYTHSVGALSVGPHLRLEWIDLEIDGFTEKGAGVLDFRVDGQETQSLQTDLGVDVAYAISTSFGILSPYARASWIHEWDDDGRNVGVSFAADPRRQRFLLRVSNPDRDFVLLGGGVSLTLVQGRSLFLDFEAPVGLRDTENYSLTGGVRLAF